MLLPGDMTALRNDVVQPERRLDVRFEELELRTGARFETVDARFEALEHKITSASRQEHVASTRTFVTWMTAVGGAVVTSVGCRHRPCSKPDLR